MEEESSEHQLEPRGRLRLVPAVWLPTRAWRLLSFLITQTETCRGAGLQLLPVALGHQLDRAQAHKEVTKPTLSESPDRIPPANTRKVASYCGYKWKG